MQVNKTRVRLPACPPIFNGDFVYWFRTFVFQAKEESSILSIAKNFNIPGPDGMKLPFFKVRIRENGDKSIGIFGDKEY